MPKIVQQIGVVGVQDTAIALHSTGISIASMTANVSGGEMPDYIGGASISNVAGLKMYEQAAHVSAEGNVIANKPVYIVMLMQDLDAKYPDVVYEPVGGKTATLFTLRIATYDREDALMHYNAIRTALVEAKRGTGLQAKSAGLGFVAKECYTGSYFGDSYPVLADCQVNLMEGSKDWVGMGEVLK